MSEPHSPVLAGWMKLFHPSGVLVSLPVEGQGADPNQYDYAGAFAAVGRALAAGFTVNAPGLEAGEQKEECLYVARREKENKDKSITPIIDLYSSHEAVQYKVMSVYLNDEDDVEAFQFATGVKLNALAVFPGNAAVKRGESAKTDRFIVKAPKPFGIVIQDNPKYSEADAEACAAKKETYKVPKRLFVRWADKMPEAKPVERPAQQPDPNSREANGASDKPKNLDNGNSVQKPLVDEWTGFLSKNPTVEALNERLGKLSDIKHEYTRRVAWTAVCKYAENAERCWEFNDVKKVFVAPAPVEDEGRDDGAGAVIPF